MAVYVDNANISYRRMKMCHMLADTEKELHAMADKIGVQRKWFQGPKITSHPHYDICLSKRALAVEYGAVEVKDKRAMVNLLRRLRDKLPLGGAVAFDCVQDKGGRFIRERVPLRRLYQP